MISFRFLNYHTEYSSSGSMIKDFGEAACFSKIFRSVSSNDTNTYTIRMYRGIQSIEKRRSNICLLTPHELRNHICKLKSLYPFKYKIKINDEYYDVIITISKQPATFHKYALTWIRYAYEYPFCLYIRDVYKLSRILKFENINNLFNLVIQCANLDSNVIHRIPGQGVQKNLTISKVRERLKHIDMLNSLHERLRIEPECIEYNYKGLQSNTLEYWEDEDCLNDRIKKYLNTYKNIKIQK